jgi:hypothetical protein
MSSTSSCISTLYFINKRSKLFKLNICKYKLAKLYYGRSWTVSSWKGRRCWGSKFGEGGMERRLGWFRRSSILLFLGEKLKTSPVCCESLFFDDLYFLFWSVLCFRYSEYDVADVLTSWYSFEETPFIVGIISIPLFQVFPLYSLMDYIYSPPTLTHVSTVQLLIVKRAADSTSTQLWAEIFWWLVAVALDNIIPISFVHIGIGILSRHSTETHIHSPPAPNKHATLGRKFLVARRCWCE